MEEFSTSRLMLKEILPDDKLILREKTKECRNYRICGITKLALACKLIIGIIIIIIIMFHGI